MIEEPPRLSLRRPDRRPSDAQIAAFQNVPTSFVADALGGGGAMEHDVKPLWDAQVAGPALTAGNGPGDIMATLGALAFIKTGDVLVSAAGRYLGCAAAGDRVCGMARNAGAVGLVTDGAARDVQGIAEVGLPIWCRGVTPASPFTTGPGTIGLPVVVAGQHVETGDMIVADGDGVIVVPFDRLDAVIQQLDDIQSLEKGLDAEVSDGLKHPAVVLDWLNDPAITKTVE